MLVAITGASGLVGSYTVGALKDAGHEVRAMVRAHSRRDHIEADVDQWCIGRHDDPQSVAALVAGADCVIHASVDWSAEEIGPIRSFESNVLGSLRLLEAARQAGVGQFIFVSSVAVHHEILPGGRIDENHPTWPNSIYGAGKAAVEAHLKAYHHAFGMNTSAWRPAAIYGIDPQLERSQWYDLIETALEGGTIDEPRGGKITHVRDVADALTYAVGDENVAGEFYDLVDGYMYWQGAAELARELSGVSATILDRTGPGPKNHFDTTKAVDFFNRHGNAIALRRGVGGVREYVRELLGKMSPPE